MGSVMKITLAFGILSLASGIDWDCGNNWIKEFARDGTNKTISFYFESLPNTNVFVILLNTVILTVMFDTGGIANLKHTASGYRFVGEKDGTLNLEVIGVSTTKAGVYISYQSINGRFTNFKCVTIYQLGSPSKPVVSTPTTSVGSNVILTCSSNSTTVPSNHSLSLQYAWDVDNRVNPNDNRYEYSTLKRYLTISNVVKEDASKQFRCSAEEIVTNGYTSVISDPTSLLVLYGPENMRFSPLTDYYEQEENTNLADVICQADCQPICTFQWTKLDNMSIISTTNTLPLGTLSSAKAGIYRCTATRSLSVSQMKDLTVMVIYGPKYLAVLPSSTPGPVRQDEGSVLLPRTCSAQCWLCDFEWRGSNGYMSNNSSLTLGTLGRSDHGNYTCTATNMKISSRPKQTTSLTIEVRYGPDAALLTPDNTSYTVDELTQLSSIVCVSDCFPTCTYKWTKQNQNTPVSTTDTLTFGIVTKDFSANYTCTATNTGYRSVYSTVEVKVRYGPYQESTSLNPTKPEHRAIEGDILFDIICNADCFPDCTYIWKKQGTDLILSTSSVLSLGIINRNETGMYRCTAINPGKKSSNTTSKDVQIEVIYGPDTANVDVTQLYETIEGNNMPDITCSSDCFPDCTFTWKKNNGTVSFSGKLSLGKVLRQHAGSYTCTSTNTAYGYDKTARKTIQIVVKYAPTVTVGLSSSHVTENSSLTLICEGAGVPENYTYTELTQTVGSVVIPNTNIAKNGTSVPNNIRFTALQLQDTGTYTCRLNNGIPDQNGRLDQSASLNLTIDVVPKVLRSGLVFAGATDGLVTINIPFYCHPVVQSIRFAKMNNTIIASDEKYNISLDAATVYANFYGKGVTLDGYQARLTIFSLKEEDFSTYQLNITNKQGTTSLLFFVNAESPPTIPKHFIYSPESDLPTLIWSKGFNGGHEQTFSIETAIPDSGNWDNLINVSESDTSHQINEIVFFANITGLKAGTYTARLTAWNSIGKAEPLYLNSTFTVASDFTDSEKHTTTTAAIVGGIVSAVVLLVTVAVILIILKRRAGNTDKETSHLQLKKHGKMHDEDNNSDEDETIENPMYDRGPQQPVYSTPEKKKNQKEVKLGDVYATVDKSKKSENKEVKKENPKKKKQIAQGDIYENVPEKSTIGSNSYGNAAFEDNTYENPEGSKPSKTPKKNINPDGLIYADLAFNEQPKGQKKLVIHGLDEMTTYVQVDFNRKADPLPDSDTEEQSENKKN